MLKINNISEDYSIRQRFRKMAEVQGFSDDTEMYIHDSAFLCGLLRKYKPRKILEIGVAGGGTTSIILQCMEEIGNPYKMYSVDILNKYYRKPEKDCGYLANEVKKNLKHGSHEFMLGKVIAY
ncbi:MAG: hypothetical protein IKN43_14765, partial [Selenomonadaceae bacterium]|nr:hypothetical protein [Selenomonadaceae bacterium]